MPSNHSQGIFPVINLLIATILWGIVWYPLRLLENLGLHGVWVLFITYGIAVLLGIFLFNKKLLELYQHPMLFTILALASAWCNIAFVLAVLEGNVVRVMLLFYLSPVWTTLLGWLFLKEQLTATSWLVLAVAMVGSLFMLWEPSLGFPWPQSKADWLAVTSGMAFSVANVVTRRLQSVSVVSKTYTAWLGIAVVALLIILLGDLKLLVEPGSVILWVAVVGTIMVFLMTITVQYGVTHMPVYRSAIILLFELVVAAISAQLLTDELVTSAEWLGGALIVTAAYISARSYQKSQADI